MEKLTPEYNYEKPWWKIAKEYFESHRFVEHQLDSYNEFMTRKLPDIITLSELRYAKDTTNFVLSFENVYVRPPEFTEPNGVVRKLKPNTCRIRNLTYYCHVYVDITRYTLDEENKAVEQETFPEVYIGAIPTMVGSQFCRLHGKSFEKLIKAGECPYDPQGYFIITGNEKVLVSPDRMAHNEIFVFKSKDKDTIKLPSSDTVLVPEDEDVLEDTPEMAAEALPAEALPKGKSRSLPCAWSAEVRSFSEACEPNISTTYIKMSRQQLDKGEDQRLYIEMPGMKCPVAWPIVFMALNVLKPEEMVSYVCDKDDAEIMQLLQPSLHTGSIKTQAQALRYLEDYVAAEKNDRSRQLKMILRNKLFQNVLDAHSKKYYLGHMTRLVLNTILKRRRPDDRDHYGKKRVVPAGGLINDLFKSVWKRVLRETKNILEKKRNTDLTKVFYGKFTGYLKTPFATGNWTAAKSTNKPAKAGISQLLNRHNYISTLSSLRRVVTPGDKNSKIVKPRHLHDTHWNFICPVETPEGQSTGLIKNLALLTTVTLGSPGDPIINWLAMMKIPLLEDLYKSGEIRDQGLTKVFVNSNWVTSVKNPEQLLIKLRKLRRENKILREVSISLNAEGLRVFTDEGRLLIPFVVIRDGKFPKLPEKYTWRSLVDDGIVEYLDPSETETLFISEFPWKLEKDHTHSVIHPSLMLGVSGSTAPFPDHNQCIFEDEIVYMADGTSKAIKDVQVNDEVVTFDPETHKHSTTKIVHTYHGQTDKKMYEIETWSGRKIKATFDHRFMTSHGWKQIEDVPAVTWDNITPDTPLLAISIVDQENECLKAIKNMAFDMVSVKDLEKIIRYSSSKQTLFVPIKEKRVIESLRIADITTESTNQSFLCADRFCVHNSPRNVYQSAMGKQALGLFALNFLHRFDTGAHVLCYPQKPLVNTKPMQLLHSEQLPAGQNLIVAIATAGYNQEDSVVVNQAAIDRGALRSLFYATQSENHYKKGNTQRVIKKPEKIVSETRIKGYAKLDSDGLTKEATPVALRDIVVGMVTNNAESSRDTSATVKSNGMEENSVTEVIEDDREVYVAGPGSAMIDRVLLTLNEESYRTAKVRIRQTRVPQIGDKVASRSAQKGIIGMTQRQEDMPWTTSGISPDIIVNPHAIPSRMTIAQPLETMVGKLCALLGGYADCTPFEPDFSEEAVAELLEKQGFQRYGEEQMMNGYTGEKIPCTIFIGPTYYQRLKHMVDDKIHCLSPDHEVLCADGWKPIAEVTVNDRVATLQQDCLVYEHPEKTMEYDYDGAMYETKSAETKSQRESGVSLLTTMNHRMWVSIDGGKFDFTQADKLLQTPVRYQKDALWQGQVTHGQGQLSIGQIGWVEFLQKYLVQSPGAAFSCMEAENLLPNVFNLSRLMARAALSGAMTNQKIYCRYQTCADQFQQLFLHAGWSASVKFRDNCHGSRDSDGSDDGHGSHDSRDMYIVEKCNSKPTILPGRAVNYMGKVYCLQVPGGVFHVRRQGLAVWTGNSRDQNGPRETLTRQPVEGQYVYIQVSKKIDLRDFFQLNNKWQTKFGKKLQLLENPLHTRLAATAA